MHGYWLFFTELPVVTFRRCYLDDFSLVQSLSKHVPHELQLHFQKSALLYITAERTKQNHQMCVASSFEINQDSLKFVIELDLSIALQSRKTTAFCP